MRGFEEKPEYLTDLSTLDSITLVINKNGVYSGNCD